MTSRCKCHRSLITSGCGIKKGIAEGEERKLVQNLRTAIRKGMTPAEAMDFVDVPEKDRPKISKMLEPEKV